MQRKVLLWKLGLDIRKPGCRNMVRTAGCLHSYEVKISECLLFYTAMDAETPQHPDTRALLNFGVAISPVTSYVICSIIQSLNFVIANSSDCLIKAGSFIFH